MSRVEDRLYSRDKGNDNSIDVRPFLASDFFVGDFPIMNHKHGVLFMSRILRRAPIVLILLLIALAGSADADWQKVASIGTSSEPYSVAVDGTNAYVTCFNSNTLDIINLNTHARTSYATGFGPFGVAVDGTNAYVTCFNSNTLDIINLDTHARTSYATNSGPFGVAVDGTNAYVTCFNSNTLEIIDLNTYARTSVATGPGPFGVAVDGTNAYVTCRLSNTLDMINLDTHARTSVATGPGPSGVAVDGTNAYVTCFNSNTLDIINLNPYARTSYATGSGPSGVAVDGTNAYVTCFNSNTLDMINLNTHARTSYATGSGPFGVAVDGTNAYVTCQLSNTLEIFQQRNCLSGYKIDVRTGLPLSGWEIVVNNSGQEWNTTTNAAGFWQVCNLKNDNYTVCEVPQPGWIQTSPQGCRDVTLAGSNIANINFTNQNVSCIDGYKLDTLGNKLSGWMVFVDKDSDGVLDPGEPSDVTDSSGYWQICGLNASSTVNLTELSRPGWRPSLPPQGWQTVTVQPNNETGYINFTNKNVTCTGLPKVLTVCASGCNYTSIQAAINAACPGDTILVHSGTYYEHVDVNKTLTLQGVDTGAGLPVVDGGGSGGAITLSADGCTLQGFVARNSGSGNSGIRVTSSGNTISGNTATGNRNGISLSSSTGNTLSDNIANGNILFGITLSSSSNNTLSGNTATNNQVGIHLTSSTGNTVTGNTANGNRNGFALALSSNSNTLSGNTATGNQNGILLSSSNVNTITGNTANGNSIYGIHLTTNSNSNIIWGNTATGNSQNGIHIAYSNNNTIYLNTFNNINNALSTGANHWNATTTQTYEHEGSNLTGLLGNIWSDYDGVDCDGDGVGDTPYNISGGSEKDYHPIGGVQSGPSLSVEKLADRSEAEVGDWINYTIQVNNTGNVTLTGVRAEDNLTGAVWTVGTLSPGQNYTNTTRYQVMLSDLPGPLTNQLLVNGTDPCGTEVNASALETVQIPPSCTGVPKVLTVCASGCNYTSIQAAINAACPGDTILVHSGTYFEHVNVNKTLTLQGVDTAPVCRWWTSAASASAITISADGCTLQGFVARNSGAIPKPELRRLPAATPSPATPPPATPTSASTSLPPATTPSRATPPPATSA